MTAKGRKLLALFVEDPVPQRLIPLQDAVTQLLDDYRQMLTALHRIASWPEGPEVHAGFDEPSSASVARAVLHRVDCGHETPPQAPDVPSPG